MFFKTKQFTINKDITSRDIHRFAYFVQGLSSNVYVSGDRTVNAESILGMFSLNLSEPVTLRVNIPDTETDFDEKAFLESLKEWSI